MKKNTNIVLTTKRVGNRVHSLVGTNGEKFWVAVESGKYEPFKMPYGIHGCLTMEAFIIYADLYMKVDQAYKSKPVGFVYMVKSFFRKIKNYLYNLEG